MSDLVSLYFLKTSPPYNAGEKAGFPPSVAKMYLAMDGVVEVVGKVVEHDPPKKIVIKKVPPKRRKAPVRKKG
jgi:hypothetical protein